MADFKPVIVDVSHYEVIDDDGWQKAKDAGLLGMIAKATQGTHYADPNFADMMQDAAAVGLYTGAYHFNTGEDPLQQADWFLHTINPNNAAAGFENILVALDYEKNPRSDMSISDAVRFLHRIEDELGRKAVIYSGDKLKETIGGLGKDDQLYVCSHKLWLAQYGPRATVPDGFNGWWLHQYTGDGFGPNPHWIDGIKCPGNKGLDLNRYYKDDTTSLAGEWIT